MTRNEVLARLLAGRGEFDAKVAAVPRESLDTPVPGGGHSPKQIVAHVNAYEQLITERLRAAQEGRTTELDRDREGWEAFNERIWSESAALDVGEVLARSHAVFAELAAEVGRLADQELESGAGVSAFLDPAWLDGRVLWELIGIDAFDHYAMHFGALEAAARAA